LRQHPRAAALWLDDLWRLSPRWIIEAGVRGETLSDRRFAALSPRLSVKHFLRPNFALTAAAARVTQAQHSLVGDGPLRYFEVWIASDSVIPVATAWHWAAGAERRLGGAGTVRVEGFYKRYDRVLDANPSEDPAVHGDEFFPTTGSSYGIDLLARMQRTTRVSGWLAYTYGVSSRSRDGVRWAPGQDRRHDLNLVATGRLAKYRLGARLGIATGTPYTPIVGEIARRTYDPSTDRWGTGDPPRQLESLGGARNGARFPMSKRLDLDASRVFTVRGATVAPYVSVINSFNSKNVLAYVYHYSVNPPTRRAISQFPILPSLGVRIEL
ncbi:MAG TPA: TonB-dependent receptor, partial [Gemmatimonadaceae bacterium]|nr:TonB-dependent receptor [Gemmatimonadaceae bacterium]